MSAPPVVERQLPGDAAAGNLFPRGETALVEALDIADHEIVCGFRVGREYTRTS